MHVIGVYLYQSDLLEHSNYENVLVKIGEYCGLTHFNRFEPDMWPTITGLISLVMLFLVVFLVSLFLDNQLCHWNKVSAVHKILAEEGEKQLLLVASENEMERYAF